MVGIDVGKDIKALRPLRKAYCTRKKKRKHKNGKEKEIMTSTEDPPTKKK